MTNTASLRHLAPEPRDSISRHPSANNAFIAASLDFDDLIAKLQAARTLNFGAPARTQRNWSDAASIAELNRRLENALAFITGTEE